MFNNETFEVMTASVEKKYKLIQLIMSIEDDDALSSIEASIAQNRINPENEGLSFWTAVKPIRKGVSFQQILLEQNYQPLTYEEFSVKAAEVDIQESVEELLAMLTK